MPSGSDSLTSMRGSVVDLPPAKGVFRYVSCVRVPEVLALQGAPLLGAAFAIQHPGTKDLEPLVILTLANVLLVAHVFLLNDWAGVRTDLFDPNKSAGVFTRRGVDRREIGGLTIVLLAASLVLFSNLGGVTLALALAIAALSALYSLPLFDWKGRPILSSMAHLMGGALHFALGYSLVGAVDTRAIALAIFCGVSFTAGHLTQEIRDYQSDERNGIRTNAVMFGPRTTFVASVVLFTLAYAILFVLALQGILPRAVTVLALLYPVHVRWSLEAWRDDFTYASIDRLQGRYHLLYGLIGAAIVTALFR